MAVSDVKYAAQWLGNLVVEEMKYLGAVRDEVEELQIELEALAAFLNEAVQKTHKGDVLQNSVFHARNVAYDCEDVIEMYILKVARHGYEEYEGCHLGSLLRWGCILGNAVHLHEIRSKIERLHRRISSLQTRMAGYWVPLRIGAESNPAHHLSEELRRIYTHNRAEHEVVGLDKDLGKLIPVLLDPDYSERTVIAIYGMDGIGKSTLARELYHHFEIRTYFQAFAWAEVSRQFRVESILERLIYQIVPKNDRRRETVEQDIKAGRAHRVLHVLMKETKCFVVVDDIWTSNDWARLQAAFPKDLTGSRILFTTRNQETLSGLDPNLVYSHLIQGLDDKRSWELFEKTTFPSSVCTDPRKKKLGQEMLRHCSGVPLAIVVLGKVLQTKERVEDWKQMHDNISAQIQGGGAPNQPYRKVFDVLQVSYDELPSHLKHCFLHLANFPEDFEISADTLFHLWAGEGIILKEHANELEEDVAERYLNELVSRNMVQVGSWSDDSTGRIKTCRLHDLMRDICIEVANEEGFHQIITSERPMQSMASLPEEIKHCVV